MRYSAELSKHSLISRISGSAVNFDDLQAKCNALLNEYPIKSFTVWFDEFEVGECNEKKND